MRRTIPGSPAVMLALMLALMAGTAAAEAASADAMEAQRCIWRCGDATSLRQPAYDRCIARQCDTGPKTRKRRR